MNPRDKKQSQQLELIKQSKSQLEAIQKQTTRDTLLAIEDKLLDDSINIVNECNEFANLGFDESGNPVIPESWEFLPPDIKEKRIRLAKANWMPSSDVPHGIKMAYATAMGIIKARATKESGNKSLNIETAVFPAPQSMDKPVDFTDALEVEE